MRLLSKALIWLTGIVLLGAALFLAAEAEYKSPESRLWASPLGYPALARRFDWPIPVDISTVSMQQVTPSVSAEGRLQYDSLVPVAIDLPGIVIESPYRIGETVEKGAVLFRIDRGGREVQAARLEVELKRKALEATTASLERTQGLRDRGLITYGALYDYESEQRDAEEAFARAVERLRLSLLSRSDVLYSGTQGAVLDLGDETIQTRAPTDGIVLDLAVSVGETLLIPKASAMVLGADLKFQAFMDQVHFSQIAVGQTTTVYLLAHPDTEFSGQISRIEPFVAGTDSRQWKQPPRTFSVWIDLDVAPDQLADLAQGMNGYTVVSHPEMRLTIPTRALVRYSGKSGAVLVVDEDGILTVREVTFSSSDGTTVAIESGLEENEKVVVGGQVALGAGDWVVAD